jgi:hypothetical protein
VKNLLLGGYLNLSFGDVEVWGPSARPDPQSNMFSHFFSINGLIDLPPIKLLPSWWNMRTGDARVEKILDRFLVHESLLDYPLKFRQWISSGGESDHYRIWLELEFGPKKPTIPFKFNTTWLEDEELQKLVKENWVAYDPIFGLPTTIQFVENVKIIKQLTLPWDIARCAREDKKLRHIESQLDLISNSGDGGYFSQETKDNLKYLETRRKKLLDDKEDE